MLKLLPKSFLALILMLLAVAACTPAYVNTEELGKRATEAEITSHYSGKSLAFPGGPTGINSEAFYGSDGTFKIVSIDEPAIGIGTWDASTIAGDGRLTLNATFYSISDGKVVNWKDPDTYLVYIQPGGFAIVDELGGRNFTQPVPTRGFQAESRFNSLARQMGVQ